MAITSYVNGAGGTTGADLATLKRLMASGLIYYVGNSTTGASDANTGTERNLPLLTTSQAVTNASSYDTIVYLAGHNETIASSVTINESLYLVGEGTGASAPILTCGGTIAMLNITTDSVLLDNITFAASTAVPTSMITINGTGVHLNALTFSCGASDTNRAVYLSGGPSHVRITNTNFPAVASRPASAIEVGSAMAGLFMDNVTFDGGSFGWSAAAFLGTALVTRIRATRMYQFNGSDVTLATGSTGVWQQQASTGDSRFTWTP